MDKCHANWFPGESIYACGGADDGNAWTVFGTGNANDPVFRLVTTFLLSNGSIILSQSACGASVPSSEGGGIFLQVVNEHGDPIPWTGRMVAKITSQDGKNVPFVEYSGENNESRPKGICMLMYSVGTYRGFDPGVYDIEFNPTTNVPAFRWRGIRVEPNRPTIVRKTPQGVQMLAICLDHSTSMSENDLANAKANAKRIIDTSPAGTLIGVFAFGDNVETVFNYTEITDANRSNLKTKIDSISRNGSTALWKAADVALNNMNTIDPNHDNIGSIILLTDGGDNASGSITRASVVAKCQEMGVAFNSISYGDNADSNLGSASSATGGRNVHSSDSLSSLNDAFSRLLTDGNCRETITDDKGTTPSSGTWTKSFVADSSIASFQATVTLSVPSTSATVTLVAPNGTRYAANSKTDVGSESSFVFIRTNPAVGTWTVSVSAPSGTEVSCYVDASARKEPPRLSLFVDDAVTVVYASLTYGDPVDGATVKALIHGNGATREVQFEPIGAGTYRLALADCGTVVGGLTVRADAEKGVATYTYVGVFDYDGDGEGSPIPESFTRSEWLQLGNENEVSFFAAGKGMLDFQWRTSGDNPPSAITFSCDGTTKASVSSGQEWTRKEFVFDEDGTHVFRWIATGGSGRNHAAWLKDVAWHPEPGVIMSSLTATPRWPWNGLVDVDFSFVPTHAGAKATFAVSGVDGDLGRTIQAKTLSGSWRDLDAGSHRLTWNLGADAPGFHSSAFTVVLDASLGPLPAPDVQVVETTASGGTRLRWVGIDSADSYVVLRATDSSGTDAMEIGTVSASSRGLLSFGDSSAPYGKTVWYAVKATAWELDGQISAFVSARRPMLYPSSLSATDGTRTDGVFVTWTPSSGTSQSQVFRCIRSDIASGTTLNEQSWGPTIGATSGSSWLDTTAVPGVDYAYAVSCISAEGEASPLPKSLYAEADVVLTGSLGSGLGSRRDNIPDIGWRNMAAPVITNATREKWEYYLRPESPYFYSRAMSSSETEGDAASIQSSIVGGRSRAYVMDGWNTSSTFNIAWEPVEGAISYKVEHWAITTPSSVVSTSTTDCSFSCTYGEHDRFSCVYPPGRKFRITPISEEHSGRPTTIEIQ